MDSAKEEVERYLTDKALVPGTHTYVLGTAALRLATVMDKAVDRGQATSASQAGRELRQTLEELEAVLLASAVEHDPMAEFLEKMTNG